MLPQAEQRERTIKEDKFAAWLAELVLHHGAGRYVIDVAADGQIEVKRLRDPLRFRCSVQLKGSTNEES